MTIEFRHTQLANGVQIIAECIPGAMTTAVGIFVRAGARDETPAESGISHFIEHLVFKGSATRSAWDVNRELDELGGQGNAYTGEEQTCYHTTVLPRYQERAIRLLCDFLRPAFRPDDFEPERKVVLEEIAKYDDQPPFGAAELASELYFGKHPLAGRVLGTVASLQGFQIDMIKDYFARRYGSQNIVFAAAGAVDFDALVKVLDEESQSGRTAGYRRHEHLRESLLERSWRSNVLRTPRALTCSAAVRHHAFTIHSDMRRDWRHRSWVMTAAAACSGNCSTPAKRKRQWRSFKNTKTAACSMCSWPVKAKT